MKKTFALTLCLAGLFAPRVFGFSSDGSTLSRSFGHTSVLTNSVTVVSAAFTNAEAVSLRGFYYADQVPSGLAVTTLGVTLNGQSVSNYIVEVGTNGDVYAGCTPYRWVLEEPTGFSGWTFYTNTSGNIVYEWELELPAGATQTNPVPPAGVLQIVYSVGSTIPGVFNLQQFSWAAFNPLATNASFGYSESADEETVSFLAAAPACVVAGRPVTNGFWLQVSNSSGWNYAIDASTNLSRWTALATNTSPFGFTDTNASGCSARFYRARWVP